MVGKTEILARMEIRVSCKKKPLVNSPKEDKACAYAQRGS